MPQLLQELDIRLNRSAKSRKINKQVVKLKFNDFKQTTIEQRSEQISVKLFYDLLQQALERRAGRGIRLLGVSVGLESETAKSTADLEIGCTQLDLGF